MERIPTVEEYRLNQEDYMKKYPTHPLSNIGKFKLDSGIFIESGTNFGDTVQRAIDSGYKEIHSIEILKDLYDLFRLNSRFKSHIEEGTVKTYLGSSIDKLGPILENINKPVTFWLDGHLHGESKGIVHDAPIIEELKLIRDHHINTHTLLIDDMRIIRSSSWGRGCLVNDVMSLVNEINPNYVITYEDGLTPDDVLIAEIK